MANLITGFLTYQIAGITLEDYMLAGIAFVASFLMLCFFKMVVIRRLKRFAERTRTKADDVAVRVLNGVGWPLYIIISLAIGLKFVPLPAAASKALSYALFIVITFYAVRILHRIIDAGTRLAIERRKWEGEAEGDTAVIDLLGKLLKAALWVVAVVLILGNLGYNVSALVAGLGIGGIAIAFALQNILRDIFASVSIYLDKPFHVGDSIQIGTDVGTVKQIGIKSTRLETLDGDELIISNKDLTDSRVHNYKRMEKRRAQFTIGVTYHTPIRKLERIPGIITGIIAKVKNAEVDRVHLKQLGETSLVFEVVYHVKNADYNDYMNIRQAINLAILKAFQKEKIEFALT